MIEAFIIYIYTALSSAKIIAYIAIFGILVAFVVGWMKADIDEIYNSQAKKIYLNKVFAFPKWIYIAILLVIMLVPSKSDLKLIIGGAIAWNGIEKAGDIKGIEKLPENIIGAVNYFLEEVQNKKE